MRELYFISGPCGCGKTTLSVQFAHHLIGAGSRRQVYLIHGDDFHAGFIEAKEYSGRTGAFLLWPEILRFNWDCMLSTARLALTRGLDVVMDYVIEDELPLVQALAAEVGARLHYIVLTASSDSIRRRLTERGDVELIERALFLKEKLDSLPENCGHLLDNTNLSAAETVALLEDQRFSME